MSTASVVSSSNHHSIFQITDFAVTSVICSCGRIVLEMSFKGIVSTASVVSSSNHLSIFQITDSAETSVVVGRKDLVLV